MQDRTWYPGQQDIQNSVSYFLCLFIRHISSFYQVDPWQFIKPIEIACTKSSTFPNNPLPFKNKGAEILDSLFGTQRFNYKDTDNASLKNICVYKQH